MNEVADGLSRANEGTQHKEGDGSNWTIPEDWEVNAGLTQDIFYLSSTRTPEMASLKERFKDKPIFAKVIDTLLEMDQGASL